ncbi:toll/interleukin-1 receptor domain-containing protein [Cystobacter fuscus]|uniref:toll/interleukin-1 receptor domain-containing protein n=1 Tax=Cystobacter fuscus TaxID=43 RepID=UPI002B2BBD55|nr:TIR domain-containing protein [Cystobacter fuscus]
MSAPRVFISYSHDTPEHKSWVLTLANDLRDNGVDAIIDQLDLEPGQDLSLFMQAGILESAKVLLICSENYVKKAEAGKGGVGFERLVVTAEVVKNIDTRKFIPIIRNNKSSIEVPRFLGPRVYINFNDDASYVAKREELLRAIHGAPALTKRPVGPNPFHTSGPTPQSVGVIPPGNNAALDDQWFDREASSAIKGLAAAGYTANMELRLWPHISISKSQPELLTCVENSEIHTFGRPIGMVIPNVAAYKPKPHMDGIRAEITSGQNAMTKRSLYDYWALRSNGAFFLKQSLFEDQCTKNEIYFDTRIVRVTEALLFALNLYTGLGVAPDAQVSVRVSHHGLANRRLTSATNAYLMAPVDKISHEAECHAEIVVVLGQVKERLVEHVTQLTAPMFMLFDYSKIPEQTYTTVVRRFENGNC